MVQRLFTILFIITATACDGEIATSEVPSVVENTFEKKFPNATEIEWETFGKDYEVDFEIKDIDYSARLDLSGNLLTYKFEIEEETLPVSLKSFLQKEFRDKQWDDPEVVVFNNDSYYQLEIDGFFKDKKLVLDEKGNTIHKIKYWN